MKRRHKNLIVEPVGKTMDGWEMLKAFNWYRQNFTEKDAKSFLLDYVKNKDKKSIINSQYYVSLSICWIARMLQNNNTLPEESVEKFKNYIDNLKRTDKFKIKKVEVVEQKKVNKLEDAYSTIELEIDKLFDKKGKHSINASGYVSLYQLTKNDCGIISQRIVEDHILDLKRALEEEEDFEEAFNFLTKPQKKAIIKELEKLKKEFDGLTERKTTKTRKKKTIPPEEKIKNLNFSESVFGLPSKNLSNVLGKKEIYIASEKNRSLIRLISEDGFDIRGPFLTNVSSATKLIAYGKNLEVACKFVHENKLSKKVENISKSVDITRIDEIELKNSEYRSTDKYCIINIF